MQFVFTEFQLGKSWTKFLTLTRAVQGLKKIRSKAYNYRVTHTKLYPIQISISRTPNVTLRMFKGMLKDYAISTSPYPVIQCDSQKRSHNFWTTFDANSRIYN